MTNNTLAQVPSPLGPVGTGKGFGPFSADFPGLLTNPLKAISQTVSLVIGVITLAAGIYFIFQFFIGGFEWLQGSGDKARLQKAQDRLTHAVIGLLIVAAAFGVTALIGSILGLDILLKDSKCIINALQGIKC